MSIVANSGRRLMLGSTVLTMLAGLAYGAPPAGGGGGPLSVDNFSRDRIVYDSGAAAGLASAPIPVSGTGPIGDTVEARAVSTGDGGVGTTAWTAIGTVGGGGTYIGSLDVPLARSYYRIETRLQIAPATTAITGYVFAVGHVFANWGQSESARGWDTSFNSTAIPALVTLKDQILNLASPGMAGRTSRNSLNVASAVNVPVGGSYAAGIITISGTRTVRDWYFGDIRVDVAAGAQVTFDECRFVEETPDTQTFMIHVRNGGEAWIGNTDFEGSGLGGSLAAAIKEENNDVAYGKSTTYRCRFTKLPADGLKLVAGSVRWCHMHWSGNTGATAPILLWNSGTTYAIDDYAANASGNVFRSLQNGNIGNPVPATKVSDAFWLNIDPHVDAVTVEKTFAPVYIEYCNIDFSDGILASGGTGMNNYVRCQPNSGSGWGGGVNIRFNVMDRDAAENSFSFQVTTSFLDGVTYYGNWLEIGAKSTPIYPVSVGQAVEWTGNRDIAGTSYATPANCAAGTFTDETTDNIIQHIFNDRLPIGSGTVQHKFMTAADRYTVAFAAMANVALMELLGHKVVFLHQTVSGTGFLELFNDANGARSWADEQALHDYATADGASVGLCHSSWYASPVGIKNDYVEAIYELLAKKNWTTGAALTAPWSYPSTAPTWVADHFWGDLYGPARTRWCIMGPHSRAPAEAMTNSTIRADLSRQFTMENYARFRVNIRAQNPDPRVDGYLLPQGLEPQNWETGFLSNPGITDWLHPSADTIDGLGQYLSMLAHGAFQAAGLRNWPVPEFDQVFWAANGSYVEVWSSAGDVTTTRLQRGLGPIGTTYPHWTDCFAWEWKAGSVVWTGDGGLVPVEDAVIVAADGSGTPATAGRVRISKPASGTWVVGDTVAFGAGAGTGQLAHPDDLDARLWLNLPVVMVGAYGADGNQAGMSVRPAVAFTRP